MEGNDDSDGFAGGDLGVSIGGEVDSGTLGGDGGNASDFGAVPDADPLDAFGGAGEVMESATDADALTEVARTKPAEDFGSLGTAPDPTPEVAAKTPEQRLEELIGPDPLAFMKKGPTGFYGLDSGLETIEGLKEEFITVARCLAHWYIKTDGMRGAPAANLAMERLLPHYPELAGVIKIPPLPPAKSQINGPAQPTEDAHVRELGAARAPAQLAAADGDTDFTTIGPGQVGQADETAIRPEAEREIDAAQRSPNTIPTLEFWESRQWAIRTGRDARFEIADNPKETGDAPFHREHEKGVAAVSENDAIIEREARRQNVDPDLIRATMYVENADGSRGGVSAAFDSLGLSSTLFPMNINPVTWGGMGGV